MKTDCQIWGILNVTPDSFSDGGKFVTLETAVAHGQRMANEGARVIDVGGQSSRPSGTTYADGASVVEVAEECKRVLPVIIALSQQLSVPISVDTTRAEVAEAALKSGASIVNDVSCARNADLLKVVGKAKAQYVLMHSRGQGEIHSKNTVYTSVVEDVLKELNQGIGRCLEAGIDRRSIWLDPGIGFAKTAEQSLQIMRHLSAFVGRGHRIVLGASRKAFIGAIATDPDGHIPAPQERIGGTAVTVMEAVRVGVTAVRVHDVAIVWQVIKMVHALGRPGGPKLSC
ncbi:MAG: dihydropteroate synthase [Myxococcales bacterium]|nr:dihydropteroate synthase [Myxococcales bacterium]MCB9708155.1 dihydropteroate synthase [Myxococcales bacterium]